MTSLCESMCFSYLLGCHWQTYDPFTCTRTQAGAPTTAPPTTAPPTTARRVVRRATPATLTGVNGRPTRACALSTDSKRPSFFDHPTEPEIPHATTAATNKARFKPICLITISFPYLETTTVPELTLRTLDLCQCSSKPERAADTHETG